MRGALILQACLVVLPALGGCATAGNLTAKEGCKVYGGTQVDAALISGKPAPNAALAKYEHVEPPVLVAAACCGLVDLPFSVIADTLTLPITMSRAGKDTDSAVSEQAPRKEGGPPRSE
jgi:uncharacterized protein YceK